MDIVVIAIITLFLPYLIVFNERSQILDHIGMIKLLNKFQKDTNLKFSWTKRKARHVKFKEF